MADKKQAVIMKVFQNVKNNLSLSLLIEVDKDITAKYIVKMFFKTDLLYKIEPLYNIELTHKIFNQILFPHFIVLLGKVPLTHTFGEIFKPLLTVYPLLHLPQDISIDIRSYDEEVINFVLQELDYNGVDLFTGGGCGTPDVVLAASIGQNLFTQEGEMLTLPVKEGVIGSYIFDKSFKVLPVLVFDRLIELFNIVVVALT